MKVFRNENVKDDSLAKSARLSLQNYVVISGQKTIVYEKLCHHLNVCLLPVCIS